MHLLSQPKLASRLTAMTRGEPLELKLHGKDGIVVTAFARVERMTLVREDGGAELNPVNETSTFAAERRLRARTFAAQGQLGGSGAREALGGEGVLTGGSQQRDRFAWRGREADRVYANGKYPAGQTIYRAELMVDIHLGKVGDEPDASAPVHVEVGLESRDTLDEGTSATQTVFDGPKPADTDAGDGGTISSASGSSRGSNGHVAENSTSSHRSEDQSDRYRAPRRMREDHQLNASYVVHGLTDAGKVRTTIEEAVRSKYGEPSDEVKQRIGETFDRVALRTQLSQLTRGGKITETVAGRLWSAEITVTAKLGDATYQSTAGKYEFESGTQTSSGQGYARDRLNRHQGGILGKFKSKFIDVTGGYTYRLDRTYGDAADTVGSVSNRGKHTEAAAIFDVKANYDVEVRYKWLNVHDGSFTDQVTATARVAVPLRDAEPMHAATERITEKQPSGFLDGRRLDSSAIVADVFAARDPAREPGAEAVEQPAGKQPKPKHALGESILDQLESKPWPRPDRKPATTQGPEQSGNNPFKSDWDGLRRKLAEELTPDKLQARLKAMTAGDEIVVRHGRTTVRVSAVLGDRMVHLGESGVTEFNAGTQVQRTFASSDGVTNFGAGQGHNVTAGVVGTVPVAGFVPVTVGLAGNFGWGKDHMDLLSRSNAAGSATKAKVAGSAFEGEAELQFEITRRPLFGASVSMMRTARIGFETIVESSETRPVPPPREGAAPNTGIKPTRTLPAEPPASVTVPVPPERVWTTGLRDTDVLRWLGDVGGVQDLVRLRGRKYFGAGTWRRIGHLVGNITSHSHLSALFGTASQGMEIATATPGRWLLGQDKGVEVRVKLVELRHRENDKAVELSPSNGTSFGSVLTELSAKQAGVQGQAGVKVPGDTTNSPGITGGAQRVWRDGGMLGDTGQVISNGKFPTPMARYAGAAEIEVTFFDGKRERVTEKGVVPFTVDIPLAQTVERNAPGDTYPTFSREQQGGELRFAESPTALREIHLALETPGARREDGNPSRQGDLTQPQMDQLLGTFRVGRTAYDGAFTSTTEEGLQHIRATHRLVELAGGSSTAAARLVRELLQWPPQASLRAEVLRKVIGFIEERTEHGGTVTLAGLRAWAAQEQEPVPPVAPVPPVEPGPAQAPVEPAPVRPRPDVAPNLVDEMGPSLADDIFRALNG